MPLLLRYNDRFKQKSRRKRCKACDDVVEPRGVEPLSENPSIGTSPSADDRLHSLHRTWVVTLPMSVES